MEIVKKRIGFCSNSISRVKVYLPLMLPTCEVETAKLCIVICLLKAVFIVLLLSDHGVQLFTVFNSFSTESALLLYPISYHWSLSIPPGNLWFSDVFRGYRKGPVA